MLVSFSFWHFLFSELKIFGTKIFWSRKIFGPKWCMLSTPSPRKKRVKIPHHLIQAGKVESRVKYPLTKAAVIQSLHVCSVCKQIFRSAVPWLFDICVFDTSTWTLIGIGIMYLYLTCRHQMVPTHLKREQTTYRHDKCKKIESPQSWESESEPVPGFFSPT